MGHGRRGSTGRVSLASGGSLLARRDISGRGFFTGRSLGGRRRGRRGFGGRSLARRWGSAAGRSFSRGGSATGRSLGRGGSATGRSLGRRRGLAG